MRKCYKPIVASDNRVTIRFELHGSREMPVSGQAVTPKAVLLLLDNARHRRDAAARARRLAGGLTTQSVYEELTHYAAELEHIAQGLELQAIRLAEKIARTRAVSEEIRLLVTEARARLSDMKKPPI